jgi:hypothetical protein
MEALKKATLPLHAVFYCALVQNNMSCRVNTNLDVAQIATSLSPYKCTLVRDELVCDLDFAVPQQYNVIPLCARQTTQADCENVRFGEQPLCVFASVER